MPILEPNSFEVISRNPEQTRRMGMRLGSMVQPGDVICLSGELGSGKTTLVQGLTAGWGSPDQVSSPTFVLVNVYRRMDVGNLYHLDAYRLQGASEAIDLDLDLMIEKGPMVVEWADRIKKALPDVALWIYLKWIDELHRDILVVGQGSRPMNLMNSLKREIYGNR
jgi:tRNA threonylcarbamoyladenosine biosynthesis protein TsaE